MGEIAERQGRLLLLYFMIHIIIRGKRLSMVLQ